MIVLSAVIAGVGESSDLRLGPSLPSVGDPQEIPRRELLRHGPPGVHAKPALVFMSDYSQRNATMGSTLAARRAGM